MIGWHHFRFVECSEFVSTQCMYVLSEFKGLVVFIPRLSAYAERGEGARQGRIGRQTPFPREGAVGGVGGHRCPRGREGRVDHRSLGGRRWELNRSSSSSHLHRRYQPSSPESSRCSHARAIAQPRLTVIVVVEVIVLTEVLA